MKVIGYAGATKTTTLELLARSTRRRGLYLAFSRSDSPPGGVQCQFRKLLIKPKD